MAATTNHPALTISQRGALHSAVMDYAMAFAAYEVAVATGRDAEYVQKCKLDVADAWRAYTSWTLDVKWVDPSL
jgi:hypothetical protein